MSAHVIPVAPGARRAALDAGGFSLTEAWYGAGRTLPPHAHQKPVLTFILDGLVHEQSGSERETCGPLDLLAIPAGEPHSETFPGPGSRCLIIEVSPERTAQIRSVSPLLDRRSRLSGPSVAGMALQAYRELCHPDDVAPLAIEGLVLQLSALAARHPRRAARAAAAPWLERVRDAIHGGFRRPLSIGALALEAGVHPVYLARAFRKRYGCSPAEYVRRLRVEAASEALARSDRPLAQVALEAGFADQSHFSRQFRRLKGMSPGRFRACQRLQ